MSWRKLNGEKVLIPITEAIEEAILREFADGHKLKLCIGTDSQQRQKGVEFATVIVILREKRGGFMFIENSHLDRAIGLKERMIMEVSKSIEIAYTLCPVLEKLEIDLEVHADINTNPQFESHVALKEAMGYILSMGFVFKAKPDSFASSSCADKVVN